jgi:signal transduction histidine kinase
MRRDRALPWIVFSVFLVLTCAATAYVWSMTRAADHARFDNAARATHDAITARLDTYVNVLTATRGLVVADPTLEREALQLYIRGLNIQRRYPGIQGIGLTVRVPAERAADLEREMRASGYPEFRIWPRTPPRPELNAIVLLEPEDARNRVAMGFDMTTQAARRRAMDRARDSGRPAATSRVTLVQEVGSSKQAGFLIYTPLYGTGTTPATLVERRGLLVGFIYAPFRFADLFHGIFGTQERPELGFRIYDGKELLYESPRLASNPRWRQIDTIEIAGRRWGIELLSTREGYGGALRLAIATFSGGMLISVLLLMLMRTQLAARAHAEATAERLRTSEAALQRANTAKDDFLATLSHELRTPMTAILGWTQMLTAEKLDPETQQTALEAIGRSAKVQAQLIDDLLDVSRIAAGKMKIDLKPVELGPVVAAAMETVRPLAEGKGIHITADVEESVCVRGDMHRMQQVAWNLLTNAVKFTPANGSVHATLRAEDGAAVFEVRDDGQGIDPEFMPHLFERFRQADSSTTRAHMGLGLGLAIVSHLVELHGGTITAESPGLGKGATFRVRLPLLEEDDGVREKQIAEPSHHDALQGLRLLVVDDDEEVRNYVTAVFRASGAEVRCAVSAKEAMQILGEWQPEVILSDLAMPEEDGFALLPRMRAVTQAPVIALTAFATADDQQRVLDAGFDGFIAKPVDPSRLRRRVAERRRPAG